MHGMLQVNELWNWVHLAVKYASSVSSRECSCVVLLLLLPPNNDYVKFLITRRWNFLFFSTLMWKSESRWGWLGLNRAVRWTSRSWQWCCRKSTDFSHMVFSTFQNLVLWIAAHRVAGIECIFWSESCLITILFFFKSFRYNGMFHPANGTYFLVMSSWMRWVMTSWQSKRVIRRNFPQVILFLGRRYNNNCVCSSSQRTHTSHTSEGVVEAIYPFYGRQVKDRDWEWWKFNNTPRSSFHICLLSFHIYFSSSAGVQCWDA